MTSCGNKPMKLMNIKQNLPTTKICNIFCSWNLLKEKIVDLMALKVSDVSEILIRKAKEFK